MADPTPPTAAATEKFPLDAVYEGDLADKRPTTTAERLDTNIAETSTAPQGATSRSSDPQDDIDEKEGKIASDVSGDNDDDSKRDLEAGPLEMNDERQPHDPLVDWDGPDDPQNPLNWSLKKKWSNIGILSMLTLITPLASSMFAPAVPQLLKDFHTDSELLATWVVSVYILGYAAGPFLCAPLSEMYGRVIVYNVSNVFFLAFTLACAFAQNMTQLIIFRFFAGAFGVSPITIGGGTIADVFVTEKRAAAMAVWSIGPLIGPVIGPVCGSFLAQAAGWRWVFRLLTLLSGIATVSCFFVARETYAPVLLGRKAKQLQTETGNLHLRSAQSLGISTKELWQHSLMRPIKLMFLSPICASMNLYVAIVYGVLYVFFATFTFVFEGSYGFATDIVGLVYIGLGVGMLCGLVILGSTLDRLMQHLAKKHNNGILKPEYRLPLLIYGGPLMPVGLFIYGWSTQYHVQWAVPIVGTLIFGVGLMAAFMCVTTYLVDTFTIYAASALGANTVLRSIFGAVFPLFALKMYNALGLGWGNSLLGFLSLALCVIPPLFYKYGERIRTSPRFAVKL